MEMDLIVIILSWPLEFARETDSEARLIINDYGLESPGLKRTGMYNLVKRMLEKGVPVDGVGLQVYFYLWSYC